MDWSRYPGGDPSYRLGVAGVVRACVIVPHRLDGDSTPLHACTSP